MKTKYDWSNVPKEVKWIAKDQNNVVCGYLNEPVMEEDFWTDKANPCYFESAFHFPNIDCKDSLERRSSSFY